MLQKSFSVDSVLSVKTPAVGGASQTAGWIWAMGNS